MRNVHDIIEKTRCCEFWTSAASLNDERLLVEASRGQGYDIVIAREMIERMLGAHLLHADSCLPMLKASDKHQRTAVLLSRKSPLLESGIRFGE